MKYLKRVGKFQGELSKALGRSKTVICNFMKNPNKYGTRKANARPEKLSPLFKRRIVRKVKKKKKKTNFVNIKNIEILSGCSLQF